MNEVSTDAAGAEFLWTKPRELSLPLRISERKFLFALFDLAALALGLFVAVQLVAGLGLTAASRVTRLTDTWFAVRGGGSPVLWLGLLALLWYTVGSAFGVYEVTALTDRRTGLTRTLKAGGISTLIFVAVPYATPFMVSRGVMFTVVLVLLFSLCAARAVVTPLLGASRFRQRAVILGAGKAGRTLYEALASTPESAFELVGFLDDDPEKLGRPIEDCLEPGSVPREKNSSVRVLGNRFDLPRILHEKSVSTIVVAISERLDAELTQLLLDCLEHGVEILPMAVVYEQLTGRVPVEHVGDSWYVALPLSHPGAGALSRLVNRLMDIFLASLGMGFLLLVGPVIALAIRLESPGPVFYRQKRVGRGGRIFEVWKFRSMIPEAENGRPLWARENDPRVTRVGRFLRATHLDEFPQFINILKGEMSAVGPRPERPEFVEELEKVIPFYRLRHCVKPGMAGWGLVQQGYGSSTEDALVKLQYDLYYIKQQSFFLDIVILVRTFVDALTGKGR